MAVAVYIGLALMAAGTLVVVKPSGKRPFFSCAIAAVIVGSFSLFVSFSGLDSGDRLTYALHYDVYYSGFVGNPWMVFRESFQQVGWAVVNVAFRLLTSDVAWLLFFVSVVFVLTSLLLLNRICDKQQFAIAAVLLFFSFGPLYSFFQSRQFFAIAICNIAMLLFLADKKKWAGVFFAVSLTVHTSAIVYMPVVIAGYVLRKRQSLLPVVAAVTAIAFATLSSVLPFVQAYFPYVYQGMQGSVEAESYGALVVLKSLPFSLLLIGFIFGCRRDDELGIDLSYVSLMLSVSVGSFLLATQMYWAWRFSFFFLPVTVAYCASRLHDGSSVSSFFAALLSSAALLALTIREFLILFS